MPKSISHSHSAHALRSGAAKLWMLLVGVNHYEDDSLPSLQFPAPDCQGLGQALTAATQVFPRRQLSLHHDFAEQLPTLEQVRHSLQHMTTAAQPQDTILFYFSGHGVIDPSSDQAVLCLRDTWQDCLVESGLGLPELLAQLGQSPARQQLVWLDACHSGGHVPGGRQGCWRRTAGRPHPPTGGGAAAAGGPGTGVLCPAVLRSRPAVLGISRTGPWGVYLLPDAGPAGGRRRPSGGGGCRRSL
jgi:uncharacterized caspase-like protein